MKMEEISSNGLKTLWEKCFKRACTETRKKPGLVWERVKPESLITKREIIRCLRQNSRRIPFVIIFNEINLLLRIQAFSDLYLRE